MRPSSASVSRRTPKVAQEFGYTREIEDRVRAPLPVWLVALGKVAVATPVLIAMTAILLWHGVRSFRRRVVS
jgi:hypothetical protein